MSNDSKRPLCSVCGETAKFEHVFTAVARATLNTKRVEYKMIVCGRCFSDKVWKKEKWYRLAEYVRPRQRQQTKKSK